MKRLLKASIDLVQQQWAKPRRLKHSTTSGLSYEIRPRADKHGFDLISDALSYGPLWYRGPNAITDAIGFAKFYSRDSGLRCVRQRDRDARAQGRFLVLTFSSRTRFLAFLRNSYALSVQSNRRFQFQKRGQLFIRTDNVTLSVVAVCVSNPDRSPLRIYGALALRTPVRNESGTQESSNEISEVQIDERKRASNSESF